MNRLTQDQADILRELNERMRARFEETGREPTDYLDVVEQLLEDYGL